MTLTIKLSDEQATALQAKAASEGFSVEEGIQRLAERKPAGEKPVRRSVAQSLRDIWSDMPADVQAKLPRDGASQVDHYIYGLPKSNP